MAAIRAIERYPATSTDVEAAKVLSVTSKGITITGPAAPQNSLQNSGQAVSGATRTSGGNGTGTVR